MIFLGPVGGRLAQRRGPLRTVSVSLSVAAACTFLYGVVDVLGVLLAISVVHAVADSFTLPGNQVGVALATPPHQLAAGQGLLGASGLATAGAVGLASGWIYDHAGAFPLFTVTSAWMLVCLGAAIVWGRKAPRSIEHPAPAPVPAASEMT